MPGNPVLCIHCANCTSHIYKPADDCTGEYHRQEDAAGWREQDGRLGGRSVERAVWAVSEALRGIHFQVDPFLGLKTLWQKRCLRHYLVVGGARAERTALPEDSRIKECCLQVSRVSTQLAVASCFCQAGNHISEMTPPFRRTNHLFVPQV